MSGFAETLAATTQLAVATADARKGWAESESESDDEKDTQKLQKNSAGVDDFEKEEAALNASEDATEDRNEEEEDDSDDEDEEDESEEDDDDKLDLSRVTTSQPQKKVEKKTQNISKKERLELRQKELEDLDSLLAEFRVEKSETTTESIPKVEEVSSNLANESEEAKKKKSKKKKSTSSSKKDEPAESSAAPKTPVDISSILKARTSKNKSSSGKTATLSAAQKIAMEEAMKASAAKKKKKDKSKFNEFSY